MKKYLVLFTIAIISTSFHIPQPADISLQLIASRLNSPVAFDAPSDGSGRLFICEQSGRIVVVKNGKALTEAFLDLKAKMVKINLVYDERGLLGIAFHPEFKNNGKFYVYYSAPSAQGNHKSILAEYRSALNSDKADPAEKIIMEIIQPESNHNGGQLAFGSDGYLYIGLGDGGGAGDKHGPIGNGQNLNTLLGKILRIDVNKGNTYSIPQGNPFKKGQGREEIWAYGLRNPWRFSFDRLNGKLFCADVGQNKYEEIDIIEKGGNYGWRIMEGNHCYEPEKNCNRKGLIPPVFEYDHSVGKSITGGFVYRGKKSSPYYGKYIYADWTGKVFCLSKEASGWVNKELKLDVEDLYITSFGQDSQGELYLLGNNGISPKGNKGVVYKLQL